MSKTFQISKYFSITVSHDLYDAYVENQDTPAQYRFYLFSLFDFDVMYAPKDELSLHLAFLGLRVSLNYDFNPGEQEG